MAVFSKPRQFYSIKEKADIVRAINELRQNSRSIRFACEAMGIQPKQYRDWTAKLANGSFSSSNPKKCTTHLGRKSIIADVEDDLIRIIFEWREMGMVKL